MKMPAMVSDRPMAMKKQNRKGGGPRSAAGKATASRNALRHGFAAEHHPRSPAPERVERLARAIAGTDTDPAIVAQAFKIAENELLLSEIAMHEVWVVERMRERYAVPFAEKDNSLQLGKAIFMQMWLAERAIKARLPEMLRKYEPRWIAVELAKECDDYTAELEADPSLYPDDADRSALIKMLVELRASAMTSRLKESYWKQSDDDIVPIRLKAMLEEPEGDKEAHPATALRETGWDDRDDYEALEAAVRDLVRLDRYERRAWSRQKRAILQLANIKLERRLRQDAGPPPA